jgi:hypothetical protein
MTMEYYYSNDVMHCHQERCKKHDRCWRYQLSKDIAAHGFTYASYFRPSEDEDLSDCKYFIDKKQWRADYEK